MALIETDDLKIVKLETNGTHPVTRQEMLREIDLLEKQIDARLAEKDKAIGLLQAFTDKQPTIAEVFASVNSLEKLTDQKFKGVDTQITERDANLTVAMAAAEKAVGKTEVGFTKELDAVKGNMKSEIDGLRREISAIKDSRWGGLITSATLVIAAAGVIVTAMVLFHH